MILWLHQRLLNRLWPSLISFRLSSAFQGPRFSKLAYCLPERLLCTVSSSLTPHRESWIRESFACYFYKIHTRSQYAEDRNCIGIQVPFHIIQCSYDVTIIVPFSSSIYSHSSHNSLRNSEGQNFPKKL